MKYLFVGETNDTITLFIQIRCADTIIIADWRQTVLMPVLFNNDALVETYEIGDVLAYDMLTAELNPIKSFATKHVP